MSSDNRVATAPCVFLLIASIGCTSPPASPTPAPSAGPLLQLTGTIQETAPTEATRVAGARIEVASGPDLGRVGMANADGRFDLGSVAAPISVRVSHPGYVTRELVITSADTAIGLAPELRTISVAADAFICPTRPDHSVKRCGEMFGHPAEFVYTAPVHHAGTLRVEATVTEGWDHTQSISFDIRCQSTVVAEGRFGPHFNRAEARFDPRLITVFDAPVAEGCRYEVRVFNYGSGAYVRGRIALRVTHPS